MHPVKINSPYKFPILEAIRIKYFNRKITYYLLASAAMAVFFTFIPFKVIALRTIIPNPDTDIDAPWCQSAGFVLLEKWNHSLPGACATELGVISKQIF